jgi:hypothetical protein
MGHARSEGAKGLSGLQQPVLESRARPTAEKEDQVSDDQKLTDYTSGLRSRRLGFENGFVEKTGKQKHKWRGVYHIYVPQPDGTKKRAMRETILGLVSDMTKGEAEEALRIHIRRLYNLPAAETPDATLALLCDDYLELKTGEWEEHTAKTNTSILNLIKKALGDRPVNEIQPDELKRFVNLLPNRSVEKTRGQGAPARGFRKPDRESDHVPPRCARSGHRQGPDHQEPGAVQDRPADDAEAGGQAGQERLLATGPATASRPAQ